MDDEAVRGLKKLAESFIPKALFICLLGNLINFVILSRPCIKSSTNIYLSILAFADAVFMIFIYVLSKRYHDDVHHQTFEIYWRMFGLTQWIYTAFLYITVYVTLSLALDRYDAVSHPARTKCGIIRAKNVVSMVLFVCFLLSITAAFEFQLISEEYKNDELCKSNQSQVVENGTAVSEPSRLGDNEKTLKLAMRNDSSHNFNRDEHRRLERSFDNDVLLTGINSTNDDVNYSKLSHKTSHNPTDVDHYVNDAQRDNATSRVIPKRNHNTCSSQFFFYPVESTVAKSGFYRAIVKPISSIFLLLSVGVMVVLSFLLSIAVYRANKMRHQPGQLPIVMEPLTKNDISVRENNITLVVITLAVIFLICHTPNAVFSLYKAWLNNQGTFYDGKTMKSFNLALEVCCQLLMSINCFSKIFVYLLTYNDYWTSLRSFKSCFQCSSAPGEQIINTSKHHLFPSTKADVESLLNYSLNKKLYCTQIPPEARHHRYSISSPRIRKLSASSHTPNSSITPRLSLTPSAFDGIEMNLRKKYQLSAPQVERHQSTRSAKYIEALHMSPSQASLARSKSLDIQSTMKHSPNCRLNKKF